MHENSKSVRIRVAGNSAATNKIHVSPESRGEQFYERSTIYIRSKEKVVWAPVISEAIVPLMEISGSFSIG